MNNGSVGAELLDRIVRLNRWVTHHASWAMPLAQARVLSQLSTLGPSRIGDLARAEHCSQPTLTTLVHRLQAQGLVHRTPDPEDARATRIALTLQGLRMLAEMRQERARVVESLIVQLNPAQQQSLEHALQALSGLLDAAYRKTASEANLDQSSPGQPAPGQPASSQSTSGQPASSQSTSGQPASGQPASGQPASGQSTSGQPTTGQPTTGQPPVSQPCVRGRPVSPTQAGRARAGQVRITKETQTS